MDQEQAPGEGPPSPDGTEGRSSVTTWLLPALAFVAGVALGAVVVAVGTTADGDAGLLAGDDATPTPTATADDSAREDLIVRVPAACLDAADAAEQAARRVDDVVRAVGDLDARRLQELVDEFQRLEPVARTFAEQCRSFAGERLQDGLLVSPAPTGSP
jgi:hypothetical protein